MNFRLVLQKNSPKSWGVTTPHNSLVEPPLNLLFFSTTKNCNFLFLKNISKNQTSWFKKGKATAYIASPRYAHAESDIDFVHNAKRLFPKIDPYLVPSNYN